MSRKRQMAIPTNDYEELKEAADALIVEVGHYMHRVDQVLGRGLGPSLNAVDEAVTKVAKLIYRDDEAA